MTTQPVPAVVRSWHDEEGWGVVDSPATPGGCWVHFSAVAVDGYRELVPGAAVLLEWEAVPQDGWSYRALHAWPADRPPASPTPSEPGDGGAYASTLVLTFDGDDDGDDLPAPGATGLPPGATTPRTGRPDDSAELLRLWAATFPALPAPDVNAALAQGRVVVLAPLDGGALTGAALVGPVTDHPDERRLTVLADRPDRWAAVEGAAARRLADDGATRWHVTVREDAAGSLAQLEAAGYRLTATSWGASLRAEDVDRAALERLVAAAAADGSTLRRLTTDDADAFRALVAGCRPDFPATPATPPPDLTPQQARRAVAGGVAAAFGAVSPSPGGGRLVAATALELSGHGTALVADTELTAVDAAHRGRGLATAVKALAVLELLDAGVRLFRTGGAQAGEASLRANRRIGHVVEPLWLTWTADRG